MTTTFLHTADWQLGKPFASVADAAKRHRLRDERIESVRRLGPLVQQNGAEFILVAGDLFDSCHASKSTVSAACGAIGSLDVPVYVIPGNHDHAGPGSIWNQEFFQRERADLAPNLHVLLAAEPVVLPSAVIFPAPLMRRHQSSDPTDWIRAAAENSAVPPDLPRIVLAHGTCQGFGSAPDDDEDAPGIVNHVDLLKLPGTAIDYVALGDWHGTRQVGRKAWYSGTPEPDRFPKGNAHEQGNILKVSVSRGGAPEVEKIRSGRMAWIEKEAHLADGQDLERLVLELEETIGHRGSEHLLRLTLEGALGIADSVRLEQILESWEARLLRLALDHRLTTAPSEVELSGLTGRSSDPLISTVAGHLVAELGGSGEDAAIARLALRELHAATAS